MHGKSKSIQHRHLNVNRRRQTAGLPSDQRLRPVVPTAATKVKSHERLAPGERLRELSEPTPLALIFDSRSVNHCMTVFAGFVPTRIGTMERAESRDRKGKSALKRFTPTGPGLLTHDYAMHQTVNSSYSRHKTV